MFKKLEITKHCINSEEENEDSLDDNSDSDDNDNPDDDINSVTFATCNSPSKLSKNKYKIEEIREKSLSC